MMAHSSLSGLLIFRSDVYRLRCSVWRAAVGMRRDDGSSSGEAIWPAVGGLGINELLPFLRLPPANLRRRILVHTQKRRVWRLAHENISFYSWRLTMSGGALGG